MKYSNPKITWIIILVFISIPTIYFFVHLKNSIFLDNAMGNCFATMIGAFVGIFSALEIGRIQQENQEEKKYSDRKDEARKHKAKILRLLRTELDHNHSSLLDRQIEEDGIKLRTVLANKLKDELWNSFSDGGELHWIQDLSLLDHLSSAYYHIRLIIYYEEKYFDAAHFPGMQIQQEKRASDLILEYLTKIDTDVLKSIENSVLQIDKSLAEIDECT